MGIAPSLASLMPNAEELPQKKPTPPRSSFTPGVLSTTDWSSRRRSARRSSEAWRLVAFAERRDWMRARWIGRGVRDVPLMLKDWVAAAGASNCAVMGMQRWTLENVVDASPIMPARRSVGWTD